MLDYLTHGIMTPILLLALITVGGMFWIRLRFFPILKIKDILRSLFDRRSSSASWRALSVALAGTLGVGNIVGIAYAIKAGGAGSIFWMWVSSLFAMILKYSETVLAMLHRRQHPATHLKQPSIITETVGGPMYYITNRPFSILFAILCIASSFTVGNLIGTSAATAALTTIFPIPAFFIGILFCLLTLAITFRGISIITKFCSAAIPFFSLVYLLMCGAVLLHNRTVLPSLLLRIVSEAFSVKAIGTGLTGSVFFHALREGFTKGLITNEAGCGTAPIAHASSDSNRIVPQGFLGIIEVFFDTVILCTASALVILPAFDRDPTLDGYALVSSAFSCVFGKLTDYLLAVLIFFFVLATLVGWSYYGRTALSYLTKRKRILSVYLIVFAFVAFWGAIGVPSILWTLADLTLGLMTLINVRYLFHLRGEIINETNRFFNS
ncbi:MAG: sodium:alanine symporter family protein [Clostridia bacterium]|nr:sodium:alanine symporter family protein [Clostridia bacterium]